MMNNVNFSLEKFVKDYAEFKVWVEDKAINAVFKPHDLKLREAFDVIEDSYEFKEFENFCREERETFFDILKENDVYMIYYNEEHSLFRFASSKIENLNLFDIYNNHDSEEYAYELISMYLENHNIIEVKDLLKKVELVRNDEKEFKDFSNEELEFLSKISLNEIMDEINPIITCSEYLKNFKKNQVEYFCQYLRYQYDYEKSQNDIYDEDVNDVFEIKLDNHPTDRMLILNVNKLKNKEIKNDVYNIIESSNDINKIYEKLKEKYYIFYNRAAENSHESFYSCIHLSDIDIFGYEKQK